MSIDIDKIALEFTQKVSVSDVFDTLPRGNGVHDQVLVDAIPFLLECASSDELKMVTSELFLDEFCIKVNAIFGDQGPKTEGATYHIIFRNLKVMRGCFPLEKRGI